MLNRVRYQAMTLMVMVFLLTLAVGVCGGNGKQEIDINATPEGRIPRIQVNVALDWYPNANHLGLYVARNQAYFAQEGLDVEVYTPADPSTVLQTVGARQDYFGISYQPDVLLARAQGVPVVSVMGLVQHPLNSVMALKSSGITRPADLVGKKVGYPGIPTNEPLLDTMLKADGANGLEDVELINVGFDLGPALLSGRVDAVVGAYWTHEKILLENQGHETVVMRAEEWGVPDYYELVLVTSEFNVENDSATIAKFIRALRRGYETAMADPQAAVDILIKQTEGEIDEAVDRPGADLLVPLWTPAEGRFGAQSSQRWEEFTAWMKQTGQIPDAVVAADAFATEFEE